MEIKEMAPAKELIRALQGAKVKKVDISRACDVNRGSVYNWAKGTKTPSADHYRCLVRMCREFLSLDDLLDLGIATRGNITV